MIGNIVGDPDKVVERKNDRPVPRADQPRSDGKILVTMAFAGAELRAAGHRKLAAPM
jgi:hypothetical protein